jgi:hypothetical protein
MIIQIFKTNRFLLSQAFAAAPLADGLSRQFTRRLL